MVDLRRRGPGAVHRAFSRSDSRWEPRIAGERLGPEYGRVSHAVVSAMDILPTIARMAGATAPNALDGIDIGPILTGKVDEHRSRRDSAFQQLGLAMRQLWAMETAHLPLEQLPLGSDAGRRNSIIWLSVAGVIQRRHRPG